MNEQANKLMNEAAKSASLADEVLTVFMSHLGDSLVKIREAGKVSINQDCPTYQAITVQMDAQIQIALAEGMKLSALMEFHQLGKLVTLGYQTAQIEELVNKVSDQSSESFN
jgi:Holliday junction resolvasome RuvABC DNA-binding subunit